MKISKGFYVCNDGIFSPVFFNKDGNPYVKFNICVFIFVVIFF